MNKLLISSVLVAAALGLSACKDAPNSSTTSGAAKPAAAPVTFEAVEAEAKGFTVGSAMAVRTVYVLFDPQCPHCAALWAAAKPLKNQAKWVWVPVGILGGIAADQGATILAAPDPAKAMEEHETALLAEQRKGAGIKPADKIDEQKKIVVANTALHARFGFNSVPVVIAKNPQTGALITREGALPTADLAALLGMSVPAGN